MLPCKNALPRGSPETVKTGVALQLESKTGALPVAAVGVVVVFGARFFVGAGAGVAFTGVLFLLPFVLVAKARGGAGTVARYEPPPCCAIQLHHPPSRSKTYFSPRLGAQSEQLQYPLQAGHGNVSAKRSNVKCGYLRANESRISTADMKWELHGTPFLEAAIAVQFTAPLAC